MVEEISVASDFDAVLPHASPDPEKIDAGGVVRTGSGRSESLEAREGPPNFASYRPTNASKRRLVKGSARSAKARMRSTCSLQKSSSITPPPTLAQASTERHCGGFSSPASQPTASVFIGSTAKDTTSIRSQVEHSKVRCSSPLWPGEIRANAIRCLQTGHIGRSLIEAAIPETPQRPIMPLSEARVFSFCEPIGDFAAVRGRGTSWVVPG